MHTQPTTEPARAVQIQGRGEGQHANTRLSCGMQFQARIQARRDYAPRGLGEDHARTLHDKAQKAYVAHVAGRLRRSRVQQQWAATLSRIKLDHQQLQDAPKIDAVETKHLGEFRRSAVSLLAHRQHTEAKRKHRLPWYRQPDVREQDPLFVHKTFFPGVTL
eukprot:m.89878 g.89878  ORF g.89878 m.89878 type:complete len:162 (-) comp14989_c0_seq2:46-531(-)